MPSRCKETSSSTIQNLLTIDGGGTTDPVATPAVHLGEIDNSRTDQQRACRTILLTNFQYCMEAKQQ